MGHLVKCPRGEAFPQVFCLAGEPLDAVAAHQIGGGDGDLCQVGGEKLDLHGLADFVGVGGGKSGLREIHHSGNPFRVEVLALPLCLYCITGRGICQALF